MSHRNMSLVLSLSAQVTEEVNLSASLPYQFLRIEADAGRPASTEDGIGDLTLTGAWAPWEDRRWSFIAGLRAPTGDSDLDRFTNAPGEIVPLGFGTWDLLAGVSYSAPLSDDFRAFDTLLFTVPLEKNDDEPPPGTFLGTRSAFSVFDRLGVSYAAGASTSVYLAADLLWKDRSSGTAVSEDDGGFFLWLTPGVAVAGPAGLLVDLSIQIPVVEGHLTATVGIALTF